MKKMIWLVMLITSSTVYADEKLGDWVFRDSVDGMQIANSTNNAAITTGIICLLEEGDCSAYLAVDSGCEAGGTYPLMINSPIGAFQITSTCTPLMGSRFYMIDQFDAIRAAFESGGEVGFVMPMEGGNFRVMRFSTRGATAAIRRAMTRPVVEKSRYSDELL